MPFWYDSRWFLMHQRTYLRWFLFFADMAVLLCIRRVAPTISGRNTDVLLHNRNRYGPTCHSINYQLHSLAKIWAVLCVVDTVFVSLLSLRPTFRTLEHARMSNIVGGAMYISIALTSLTGTFMICYHIYSSTSNSKARKRYKRIVDILIQSSIMYTTAIVLETISQFVSTEETPASAVQSLILNEISTSLSSIITVSCSILMRPEVLR